MRLSELAGDLRAVRAGADVDLTGITEDSRRVTPGSLFVAVRGTALDGHDYIADAIARGAGAVCVEDPARVPAGVAHCVVPSSRAALAEMAATFNGFPGDRLDLIGFTGTFGKTSTSEVLRAILAANGTPTAVMGSLGARFQDVHIDSQGLTTPAPAELHAALRALSRAGATTVIMEVTSHALRLDRVRGLRFGGGLLAAVMPGEHTDFHRTYEDYVGAKRLFLDYLSSDATLAYDDDNRAARRLVEGAPVRRTAGFSLDGRASDLQFHDVLIDRAGASFSIAGGLARSAPGLRFHSALLGRGHLRNVALAMTYAIAAGVEVDVVRAVLPALAPLRRRMERYDLDGRTILDDTAGHADSLRAAFEVAALLEPAALVVVYALRGSRGPEVNRQNAAALADLAAGHGAGALILTASLDATTGKDRVLSSEIEAARRELAARGCAFAWHDTLRAALDEAVGRTRSGDLLLLVGAQGMDAAKEMLVR